MSVMSWLISSAFSFYDISGVMAPKEKATYAWTTGIDLANTDEKESLSGWVETPTAALVGSVSIVRSVDDVATTSVKPTTQMDWACDATITSAGTAFIKVASGDQQDARSRDTVAAAAYNIDVEKAFRFTSENTSDKKLLKDDAVGYYDAKAEQCVVLKLTAPEGAKTLKLAKFRDPETFSGSPAENALYGTDTTDLKAADAFENGRLVLYWQFFTKVAEAHTGYSYIEWLDADGKTIGVDYYTITWDAVETNFGE